jgi:hypothetical protein
MQTFVGEEWNQYLAGIPFSTGNTWLMLADDYFVEDRWNVKRVVGDVIKLPVNPILIPDRPWETNFTMLSVLYDEQLRVYHMWYGIQNPLGYFETAANGKQSRRIEKPSMVVGYATSPDGIQWTKPDLDVFSFCEYPKTNVVAVGDHYAQEHNVWLNHDSADCDRRFLMTYCDANDRGERCIMLAASPDGINWTVDRDASPLFERVRDGTHQVFFDPESRMWLYYRRPPQLAWVREEAYANHQRRYGVSFNSCLSANGWTYPRMVLVPEEEVDDPWLDNVRIVRRGSHFVCLWTAMDERIEGPENVRIALSRDGVNWNRFPHRPVFLERGTEGSFDAGEARQPTAIIDQGEHTLLYYTGNMVGQKSDRGMYASFGIARMRKDRWIGLRGDEPDGWVLTRELCVSGDRLELNHQCLWVPYKQRIPSDTLGRKSMYERGKKGYIKVELLEQSDCHQALSPISGFTMADSDTIHGDDTSRVVTWNGTSDLGSLRDKAVFVRFHLVAAELYGMRFADGL